MRRFADWTRSLGRAEQLLVALMLAGLALRVVATASFWPINADLDAASYAAAATDDLLGDPLHPAGYAAYLRAVGAVTRAVAAYGLLQHAFGIVSGLIMFAAVRRLAGSPWPALVAAAAILLNSDLVYLERTIMSESLFVLLLSLTLYATARVIEDPRHRTWLVATGVLAAATTIVRTSGLFVLLALVAAIVLALPRPWLPRWRPPATILGIVGAILLAYGFANLAANDRFELAPTPGLHLYARVAPFADCSQFSPPDRTERLCEKTAASSRPGSEFYIVNADSPASRFGFVETPKSGGLIVSSRADSQLSAFGRAAILSQPRLFARTVWDDLRRFYVPTSYPYRPHSGGDLDPQLDWSAGSVYNADQLRQLEGVMETFFDDFIVNKAAGGLAVLHDYKRWGRFGGTLLSLSTLLLVLGLLVGSRRSRIAVLLFGGTGLLLLIPAPLAGNYVGRYIVPSAGPMMAAAAIAAWTIWTMERDRCQAARASRGG